MELSLDDRLVDLVEKRVGKDYRDDALQEGRLIVFYLFLEYVTCPEGETRIDLEDLLCGKKLLPKIRGRMRRLRRRKSEISLEKWSPVRDNNADWSVEIDPDKSVYVSHRDAEAERDFWVFEFYDSLRRKLGKGEAYEAACMLLQNYTQREIAAFFGISPAAQNKRMGKIREALRDFPDGDGDFGAILP